jgi:hypothetical protein
MYAGGDLCGVGTSGLIALDNVSWSLNSLVTLDLSHNCLGKVVAPDADWLKESGDSHALNMLALDVNAELFVHSNGTKKTQILGKPSALIILANTIGKMRGLTSLDISGNGIGAGGAKCIGKMSALTLLIGSLKCHP